MTKFFIYFSFIMSLFFIAASIFVVIRPPEQELLRDNKYMFAFILLCYGLFRLWRTLRIYKRQNEQLP